MKADMTRRSVGSGRIFLLFSLPVLLGLASPVPAQDLSSEALFDPALLLPTNPAHNGVLNFRELEHVTAQGGFTAPNPPWLLGAAQFDGEWTAQGWQVPVTVTADAGALVFDLDRSTLNQNLILNLGVVPQPGAQLYVDLLDTNDVPVVTNLFGNMLSDGTATNVTLSIPLMDHSSAVVIGLRRGSGAVTINQATLTPVDPNPVAPLNGANAGLPSASATTGDNSTTAPCPTPASDATTLFQTAQPVNSASASNSIWYVSSTHGRNTYSGRLAWWDGQTHGPFATINRALSAASGSDTVVIISGRYPENVDLRGKHLQVLLEGSVDLRGKN